MKKKFWTSDKIVSFSAILISLFTLFIFVKQTNIIEEQSHLSVMPYLLMETSHNSEANEFKIFIVNHGVGPAIIDKRTILYNGSQYDMEFDEFLRTHIPEMDSVRVTNNATLQPGFALPAGGSRNLLTVGGNKKSYEKFLGIMQQIQAGEFDYNITYSSIYGHRWEISSRTDRPVDIED